MKEKINDKNAELIHMIIQGILEKKGQDVLSIDLSNLQNSVCSNFIICHAESNKQVFAIADSVQDIVKLNLNEQVHKKQGLNNAQWIVLDYVNTVVHIFQKESRDFYKLEDLWADGIITRIEE